MWAPPPRVRPSVWMERELTVPSEETAVPGRYRFTRHAFLREIVDAAVDPEVEVVAVQKPAQVGWTLAFTGLGRVLRPLRPVAHPGGAADRRRGRGVVARTASSRWCAPRRPWPG